MFYSKKLKKFNDIKHCFFSRKNGFSKGLYQGLNCGRGSNDSRKNIFKNLQYVSKKMKIKKDKLVLMYQTHSNKVKEIKKTDYKKKDKFRCNYYKSERVGPRSGNC
jgi:copper oxidase (laccase) domain-containing protein